VQLALASLLARSLAGQQLRLGNALRRHENRPAGSGDQRVRDTAQQRRCDSAEPASTANDETRIELVGDFDDRSPWAFDSSLDPRGGFVPLGSRTFYAFFGGPARELLLLSIDFLLVAEVAGAKASGPRDQHRGRLPNGQHAGRSGMGDELCGDGHGRS
jgi:hypothetical protein